MHKNTAALVLKEPTYEKLNNPSLRTNLMEEGTIPDKFFKHVMDSLIKNNGPTASRNICRPIGISVSSIKRHPFRSLPWLTRLPTMLWVYPKCFSNLVRVN